MTERITPLKPLPPLTEAERTLREAFEKAQGEKTLAPLLQGVSAFLIGVPNDIPTEALAKITEEIDFLAAKEYRENNFARFRIALHKLFEKHNIVIP